MKIFTSQQIRELDQYTISNEPVSSIDLMERAALQFVNAFCSAVSSERPVFIFAGPGNNGGDALVITRILVSQGYHANVFLFNPRNNLSANCEINKQRLLSLSEVKFSEIINTFSPPAIEKDDVIIDGLFGIGLNSPLLGGFASVVRFINQTAATVYSIDIPSGLFGEDNTQNTKDTIICANRTFSFQVPKLAFFFADNEKFVGKWDVLDICLHSTALKETDTPYCYTEPQMLPKILRTRSKFAHKGVFGHALLITGSKGKIGAAVLAAKACLKSGAGMITCHVPGCGNDVLQVSFPEAMTSSDNESNYISEIPDVESYQAIGIGPGLGLHQETSQALQNLFKKYRKPLIIDADALNLIAQNQLLLRIIPPQSILTPHPKEFDRLVGSSKSSYQRIQKAMELAAQINCYIVLKGAYTAIVTPEKKCFFNPTGNPGMATAGSGDVLTGILTGLLSQGYSPFETSLLGVYLHGLAGDLALQMESEESLTAGDIIRCIGQAFVDVCNMREEFS